MPMRPATVRPSRTGTRRAALLAGLCSLPAALTASAPPAANDDQDQAEVPDTSFRYRWITVNELFLRARSARAQQSIPYSAYIAMVNLLLEQELSIFSQASKHNFRDENESNYWRRSRLKFPSELATEVRLLEEGKDPAIIAP